LFPHHRDVAAVAVEDGLGWYKLDRLLIVGQRPVVVLLAVVNPAANVVGPVELRIVLNNRVVVLEGLIVLLSSVGEVSAMIVCERRLGVQFDGLIEISQALVEF